MLYNKNTVIFIILIIVLWIFFTIFSIKRLYDMGYSGKLLLLPYIILLQVSIGDAARENYTISTILEIIMWLVLVFFLSKNEDNKYVDKCDEYTA